MGGNIAPEVNLLKIAVKRAHITGSTMRGRNSAEKAAISISGAGDVSAYVTEDVDVSIAGAGDVTVKGNPKKVKQKINGSGRVSVK